MKRATAEGINSVLSTPLMVAARPVGALNIYSKVVHSFGPSEQERAAWFASRSSTIVADTQTGDADETVHAQLTEALKSRETISRAEGVLMGQRAITRDAAAAELRRSARRADTPMHEYACTVIASEPPRTVRLGQDSP